LNVLWLAHVGVEVVEIAQLLRPETRISIRRIVSLVVLNVNEDIVFLRSCQKRLMVFQELYRGLRDKDVDSAFDGVQSDRVVSGVRCEDGDYATSMGGGN